MSTHLAKTLRGVKVDIATDTEFPTPFGNSYEAYGFYINKKHVIVTGNIEKQTMIRIKYPIDDVAITILER